MIYNIIKAIKCPGKILPYLILRIRQVAVRKIIKDGNIFFKYKGDLYPEYLNHGNACLFISEKALTYCKGNGLDIGANKWPLPGSIPIQEDSYTNAYNLNVFPDNSLDYVFSSHCLEHLDRWEEALSLWIIKLKINGILFLYMPHESMKLWNPGGPWAGYAHKWKPRHEILLPFLVRHGMEILEFNSDRDNFFSFHIVSKRTPGKQDS